MILRDVEIPKEVKEADVLVLSHSGGADSMAAAAVLKRYGLLHKTIFVHSDLGVMEWESMEAWIESNIWGNPLHVVQAKESFFELVRRYKRLPSGMQQFCTDFLKTKPIRDFIHQYMYDNNLKTAINITGMRAEEGKKKNGELTRRGKKAFFSISKGDNTSNMHQPMKHSSHTIYDWLPLKHHLHQEVRDEITNVDQSLHWVYTKLGFSRLSCAICINGRVSEHQTAIKEKPELAYQMAKLEIEIGKTLRLKSRKGVRHKRYLFEESEELTNKLMEEVPNLLDLVTQ